MNDGHVRGKCASLASEEEEIQPEKKRLRLEQQDKPPEEEGGGQGGAGCSTSSSSSSSSSSRSNNKSPYCNKNKSSSKKKANTRSSTTQRKKSRCSICLKEGHNKAKCMYKDHPSIVPPVDPIRALSYPPHHAKPTKYIYLDFEWTTDGEFEIIEVGCVARMYCCSSEDPKEGGGIRRRVAGNRLERHFPTLFGLEGLRRISSWELSYITFQVKKK